jgi:hypothetical protein
MIKSAEIISQPYSGDFEERIYDLQSPWNSQSWTYVKFTTNDNLDWCGVFRGSPKAVVLSSLKEEILILTSDYLWKLDSKNGNISETLDQPQYQNLTIAPNGDFILADYYNIFRVTGRLIEPTELKSSIEMDMIEFKKWDNDKLILECDEFMNWERHVTLVLDSSNWSISIKTPHNNT